MPQSLEIACLQTRPMPDIDAALSEALPMAENAIKAGAKFLVLPEYCGGLKADGAHLVPPVAAEKEHPFLLAFQEFARDHKVWVLIGSLAIRGSGDKYLNRGYLLDDNGEVFGAYTKIHLFDIQLSETEVFRESATVEPGDQAVIYNTPFGKIGHTICYDLRFAQLYRSLAQAGAEIICVPAAFTKPTGAVHWHVLNRARAIENGAYIVAPCATGTVPDGGDVYGHSLVVDPWGHVVADGGTESGFVAASLDLANVTAARQRIPSLQHDRAFTNAPHTKRTLT